MSLKDRFDLVIFDWAGTMVDFGCEAPVKALIEAFGDEGVAIDEAAARRDMGVAKRDHVTGLLTIPRVADAWRSRHGRDAVADDIERIMIPGARDAFDALRTAGIRVGSSTGYTREMMAPVLAKAAAQGYAPEHVVCSGETPAGRPSPLMIYKACVDLGIWPLSRVVKVDDAEAGIAEGKAAGAFTVGVASGNTLGLSLEAFQALPASARAEKLLAARKALRDAGADLVLDSVASLITGLTEQNLRQ
jgi:phosphonoacetaldehyde hydrolase